MAEQFLDDGIDGGYFTLIGSGSDGSVSGSIDVESEPVEASQPLEEAVRSSPAREEPPKRKTWLERKREELAEPFPDSSSIEEDITSSDLFKKWLAEKNSEDQILLENLRMDGPSGNGGDSGHGVDEKDRSEEDVASFKKWLKEQRVESDLVLLRSLEESGMSKVDVATFAKWLERNRVIEDESLFDKWLDARQAKADDKLLAEQLSCRTKRDADLLIELLAKKRARDIEALPKIPKSKSEEDLALLRKLMEKGGNEIQPEDDVMLLDDTTGAPEPRESVYSRGTSCLAKFIDRIGLRPGAFAPSRARGDEVSRSSSRGGYGAGNSREEPERPWVGFYRPQNRESTEARPAGNQPQFDLDQPITEDNFFEFARFVRRFKLDWLSFSVDEGVIEVTLPGFSMKFSKDAPKTAAEFIGEMMRRYAEPKEPAKKESSPGNIGIDSSAPPAKNPLSYIDLPTTQRLPDPDGLQDLLRDKQPLESYIEPANMIHFTPAAKPTSKAPLVPVQPADSKEELSAGERILRRMEEKLNRSEMDSNTRELIQNQINAARNRLRGSSYENDPEVYSQITLLEGLMKQFTGSSAPSVPCPPFGSNSSPFSRSIKASTSGSDNIFIGAQRVIKTDPNFVSYADVIPTPATTAKIAPAASRPEQKDRVGESILLDMEKRMDRSNLGLGDRELIQDQINVARNMMRKGSYQNDSEVYSHVVMVGEMLDDAIKRSDSEPDRRYGFQVGYGLFSTLSH
jgi:hypothetical protein